jgi:uracil-DNA glycosylase
MLDSRHFIEAKHMHSINALHPLWLKSTHESWHEVIEKAWLLIDEAYRYQLSRSAQTWLPDPLKWFSAFSLPLTAVKTVLVGESPYPRPESANGFAFWDASVQQLWSETGLSKSVNRATSLRNFIKMLLVADNKLSPEKVTQQTISELDKKSFITTNNELFLKMIHQGFLLLNATLVFKKENVRADAAAWKPFFHYILQTLLNKNPNLQILLFGKIAESIIQLINVSDQQLCLVAEHPYNISFIHNQQVLDFFRPLYLLHKS